MPAGLSGAGSRGSGLRWLHRNRSSVGFGLLSLAYLLYLGCGALLFSSLELPYEDELRRKLRQLKSQFVQDNPCLDPDMLERFLARVLEANNYGVSALNNSSGKWNWDFTSSLFFAATVLTTTGYGHTVPLSDGGKAFCIIYSVIGIPFTLLFLTSVVQRVMALVTRRPIHYIHTRWGYPKQSVALAHAFLLGLVLFLCFFLIPAAIFTQLEQDWSFLESIYFCFISLSTIGLGDYVPGEVGHQRLRELYKLGITVYLMIGLTAVLVVLETFCELHKLKELKRIFYLKKDKAEDEIKILEQDQLSFPSVMDSVPINREQQKLSESLVPSPVPYQFTEDSTNR
ncbi:potassium channel subfamily K member 1-like [Mobula hypostoma]|uniref:potassium channel subfamily K member 1-like n=1 Tax=Mobula hypostoma TaxID=723540 RepID=UPI002FC303B2